MAISVTTIARTTLLSSVARVRAALGSSIPTSADAVLEQLIRDASSAIVSYCHRGFARESLTETCPGYGGIHLGLARTPVISVSGVTVDGNIITDYSIADRDLGTLYRQGGWGWTVQLYAGLSAGGGRFADGLLFDAGTPLPGRDEPAASVDYVAGYILASQHRTDISTLSADSTDNSFNDSASGFPVALKAGDIVEAIGFSNAANIGRHKVSGTPTAAKVIVTSTLTSEAAATGRSVLFHPPAECRPFDDVERALFEVVKSWYLGRGRDASVVERQIASTRVRFSETENARLLGIPPSAAGLLVPWIRTGIGGGHS